MAMLKYKVMVDDNFRYMDEDERWELGAFATAEEALAACRKFLDKWLAINCEPGKTADLVYEQYTSFGEEPFIVGATARDESVAFSARDYVRARAEVLCGGTKKT